jgi:hypothetical protein
MKSMGFGSTNVDGVIQSYAEYLHEAYPQNLDRFEQSRASDPDAALAEAVVFRMLQTMSVRPEIHDQPQKGGPDFICYCNRGPLHKPISEDRFIVEATSLTPDTVTRHSGIANIVPEEIGGGAFGLVTQNIVNKAKAKAAQLANYPMPRILAITSNHVATPALFNAATAMWALVSEVHWRHEIGSDVVDPAEYTNLERSVFLRPGPDGTIEACRKSISAILLIAVYGDKSEVYGIQHPEPAYPLYVGWLPKVPFIRISPWPIIDGKIFTEWVVGSPSGYCLAHMPVRPSRRSRGRPF